MNTNAPTSVNTHAATDGRLIASDRVEGTAVLDINGDKIGTIRRLMIEKVSGRVVYAVIAFGGFLGMNEDTYPIPWNKLDYDNHRNGYRTDLTPSDVQNAPTLNRSFRQEDHVRSGGAAVGAKRTGSTAAAEGAPGTSMAGTLRGDDLADGDDPFTWNDPTRERELHSYYAVSYYEEE